MTNREHNEERLLDYIGQSRDGVLLSDALKFEIQAGLWFGSGQTAVEVLLHRLETGELKFNKRTGRFVIATR